MSTRKTFAATASFAGAIALLAAAAVPATAQQQRAPQGWFKVCSKQEENDICNTQNIVTADSGQLLTAVNLIEIKGKINRKIFQVSVPTGRLIRSGRRPPDQWRQDAEDRLRNLLPGSLHLRGRLVG